MKIAFVADTHFGYPRFEKDARVQGEAAILDAAGKADVLLLGGDIFDTRVPRLETLAEVAQVLQQAGKKLREKAGWEAGGAAGGKMAGNAGGKPGTEAGWKIAGNAGGKSGGEAGGKISTENLIIAIHGTHERRGKDSLNPIQMLSRLGLLADAHNRTIMVESGGEKVAVSGMGGVPDDLVHEALMRLSCKPVEGAFNIFMFHQTMSEFVPQSPNLASIEELPQGYDTYLCGHMHTRKEYAGGKLLIPGSTVITQLREEDAEKKGYYLIDTNTRKAEFVPVNTREFVVLEVGIGGLAASDAREKISREIAKLSNEKKDVEIMPIAKVKITGKLSGAGELDLSGIGSDRLEVFFDNSSDGGGMAAEFEKLREQRMGKATPAEIGRARLAENAKKAGISPQRADELFAELSGE